MERNRKYFSLVEQQAKNLYLNIKEELEGGKK